MGERLSLITVSECLSQAALALDIALGIGKIEARLEARLLLGHLLGQSTAWLVVHGGEELTPDQACAWQMLLARRVVGEPAAYIVGTREFYGVTFGVTPAVLIPRPETELLVDLALARLPLDHAVRLLDLGTGSGAVALTLAAHRPQAEIVAVDRSAAALALARKNGNHLHVPRVTWVQSDWYDGLGGHFDMIVSNPPYVAEGDTHLQCGDLRFEPRMALAAGSDGLAAIRRVVAEAPAHLFAGGWLLFEHGFDQADACQVLLATAGFESIDSFTDLAGIRRVSGGRLPVQLSTVTT